MFGLFKVVEDYLSKGTSDNASLLEQGGFVPYHKYALGDKYRTKFDYGGLFDMAKDVTVKWSISDLKKLSSSLESVNYDTFNAILEKAIHQLENNQIEQADETLEIFKSEISGHGEYAKGGSVSDSLEKEVRKLQRDLNSSRLSTYMEGDNSEEALALRKEREVKLARFNEVLKLLREPIEQHAKGGSLEYAEIKKEKEKMTTELFDKCGVFFAFSNEQFAENKTPLKEGEKYISIGAGGYMPKGNIDAFQEGMKAINQFGKKKVKDKNLAETEILYELNNHECFYTSDYSDVVDMFKGTYTEKQIRDVYNKHRESHQDYAQGGKLKYYNSENQHRLGRPSGSIEREILDKVTFKNSTTEKYFVGNFGWETPQGKLGDGYLFNLDEYDQNLVKDIKLKEGEKIFRYLNRSTAIGGMTPLIKINLDKELLYFANDIENDELPFSTKGTKALWIGLIQDKLANGGGIGEIDMKEIEESAKFYTDKSRWSTPPSIPSFQEKIYEYERLKTKLDNKEITPSKIIGTGYKPNYARPLAYKWLNTQILISKRAIELLKERG